MASFASVVNLPSLQSISIRLDRTNYSFWRIQILSTVRAHGFEDLIDKFTLPPPQFLPSSSGDRTQNPDFLTWIRRDQFLASWMLSSIGETMLGHVTRCVTARDIWMVLESLFQSHSKARVMQLQLQLQTQKKGDLSVDAYFLKMREFADQLAAAGKPIADEDLILNILSGFGVEYDVVVVNITNRPDALNIQEVQYAFQAHEIRLQNQSSLPYSSANVVYNKLAGRGYNQESTFPTGGNNFTNAGGRFSRGRGGGRMMYRDNKLICQLCGKAGHVAIKCFRRFDVHFTGVTQTTPQAFLTDVSYVDQSQGEQCYEGYDPNWYVDSGATNHITYDPQNLTYSTPYVGHDQVAVGNGNQLPINSVGHQHTSSANEGDTAQGSIPA